MEKLFAALHEKHPGYKVVDVRFLIDFNEADGRRAVDLDEAFAKAISKAERIDRATVSF